MGCDERLHIRRIYRSKMIALFFFFNILAYNYYCVILCYSMYKTRKIRNFKKMTRLFIKITSDNIHLFHWLDSTIDMNIH